MTTLNGGYYGFDARVSSNVFKGANSHKTKKVTVKSGQVLKALSFIQSDVNGKQIAHTGLSEANLVTFAAITTGQTLILGGLTFTAGSGAPTAAQLVTIWSNLSAGMTAAAANTQILAAGIVAATIGTFTAGTFGSWNTTSYSATKVMFTSTTALSNVTTIVDSGTATDPVVVAVEGVTTFPRISGLTIYDVDATNGDVVAEVFTDATLWASAITWDVDPAVDTITLFDGTTRAVTAYNTGTNGFNKASTELLQAKFVEASEFDNLGFLSLGEIANG
jgi:hypothetical protein